MSPPVITRAEVDHLASLAALSLEDDEAEAFASDLARIVTYVEELGRVDTSGASTPAATPAAAWRPDVVVEGLSHADALGGAARTSDEGFAVPAFVPSSGGSGAAR